MDESPIVPPTEPAPRIWQVWVETGGTFTDCIARDPDGALHRAKVLSSSALRGTVVADGGDGHLNIRERWNAPADFVRGLPFALLGEASGSSSAATITAYDPAAQTLTLDRPLPLAPGAAFEVRFPYEAPVLTARLVTRTLPDQSLPPLALRVATTRGTNALLTRRGTPPAFFVTAGHGDLLEIGTQQRPDLFALDIVKPTPLTGAVVEVKERMDAQGVVVRPLDEAAVTERARRLVADGMTTAAIALMHSYRNPTHEQRVAEILRDAGFTHLSVSSELSPFIKLLPRAQTAVVNAYLAPIMDAYLGGIVAELPKEGQADGQSAGSPTLTSTLHVMTSAGGLVRHGDFHPKDSLLSGPAGGVVGALHAGWAAGFPRIIAFDMGGTSTDVARCDGGFDYVWEHTVGDAHLVAPALAIESVAAGGGSVCYADRHGLHVGPQSAGADPGPACYGAGGPLTLTDVNLLLGRLDAAAFEIPLDHAAAERAADRLMDDLQAATVSTAGGETSSAAAPNRESVLRGLLDIANERMADAIRRISLRRGYDPADYALVAFGGAGDQHACAVAAKLGMKTVVVPPDASLLSASGLRHASIERFAEEQVLLVLDKRLMRELPYYFNSLNYLASVNLLKEGLAKESETVVRYLLTLRLVGQETALTLAYAPPKSLWDSDFTVDLTDELIELRAHFTAHYQAIYGYAPDESQAIELVAIRAIASASSATDADLVADADSGAEPLDLNNLVESGWTGRLHPSGAAILTRPEVEEPTQNTVVTDDSTQEAVQNTLFAGRFTAIAEEMGETLRRTALSTNVKERLDFSCAVLNRSGGLIASAAHIPVHLGALSACVQSVQKSLELKPGDAIVTNHPAWGGSHLPDVTVITPVFDKMGKTLLGYVASRAHHAEIGGTRPGSMPPNATTLAEEGVVLPPMYLERRQKSRIDLVCKRLSTAPYPTRALADNRADLQAAMAANAQGAQAFRDLHSRFGADVVRERIVRLSRHAEQLLRDALRAMPDGEYAATELLDDGATIAVRVTIMGDAAAIDFAGTSPTHRGNLNATPAIAGSAVLYVLRLLVGEPIPLNEGLQMPVTLRLPPGTLVNPDFDLTDPTRCPAVVGGNTETSQRIVDTLLKALNLAACSQGTMNNTLYGNADFGYYETVCGGAGATSTAAGASAVHTHMTNTKITDSEICELRYPVRIERFALRRGSGGAGRHRGGDGIVRETVFLAPLALSVLTQHRAQAPYGIEGGEPGATGWQRVIRESGEVVELASVDGCDVLPGDRLILETPGGGGWEGVSSS